MTKSSSQPDENKPKSLWGVMGEPAESDASREAVTPDKSTSSSATSAGKGLWDVIESAPNVEKSQVEPEEVEKKVVASTPAAGSFEELLFRAEQDIELTSQAHQVMQRQSNKSWYGMGSLIAGVGALFLSTLSLFSDIYWKLPASFVGMIAVILGLLALDEQRRSSNNNKSKLAVPLIGLLCGTAAMFAGPLIFTPWGDRQRAAETKVIEESEAEEQEEEASIFTQNKIVTKCKINFNRTML